MRRYSVGFAFHPTQDRVLLIRKNKPAWQVGRLNGVGGKIEEGETPRKAMVREFDEEAGVFVSKKRWKEFASLKNSQAQVFVFSCTLTEEEANAVYSRTEEVVEFMNASELPKDVLPNLNWLVPLARIDGDFTTYVKAKLKEEG